MRPSSCWLALAVALISGCAHVVPECSAHGGTAWQELTSQHFVVRTNLELADARDATVQLERARAALLPAFPEAPSGAPLEVVLFRDAAQLQNVTSDPTLDGSFTHDWAGPLLLMSESGSVLDSTPQQRLVMHELAHWFTTQTLRRAPRWFSEGLAHYLETVTIDASAQTARRGRANQERLDEVLRWGILPVDSLWAWDVLRNERPGLEQHRVASAWFWVHFLFNEQRPALERFMRSLADGDEPRAAWNRAFAHLSAQALTDASAAYLAKGQVRTQHLELGQLNTAMSERALSNGEVHAVLARVAAATAAWPRARSEAALAVALEPTSPRVIEQRIVTETTPETRVAAARELTVANPELASGWLLLALALPQADPERVADLERALERNPDSFLALSELALRRCADGHCSDGVELAERAVRIAPEDLRVLSACANVLSKAGLCARAVATQQRAVELLGHRSTTQQKQQVLARLAEYEQCR